MSENKLKALMEADEDLVRRVEDIEVEEITLTKKGALGDPADAVVLLKDAEEVEETVEEPVQKEFTFDDAICLLKKEGLSDDQKEQIVDLALAMAGEEGRSADLEKDASELEVENGDLGSEKSEREDQLVALVKSLTDRLEEVESRLAEKDAEPESEVAVLEKEIEPEDELEQVEVLLTKALEERNKPAKVTAQVLADKVSALVDAVSKSAEMLAETQRKLGRACGEDV